MKLIMKRMTAMVLAIAMCMSLLCTGAWAVEAAETDGNAVEAVVAEEALKGAASGTCGEKLTWKLDDAGTLTISGTGAMTNWEWSGSPWFRDESIKKVIIGAGVTSIGDGAFYQCYGLTSVTIPNSVTSIGSSAFENCKSLTSITIPNSVTSIDKSAFEYCESLTSITIPNSVTSIGWLAFAYCENLVSVTIPSSVTSIPLWMLAGCSSLTSVTIPNSVTSIGVGAFAHCDGLTSITIPSSVTSIDGSAFSECSNLKNITVDSGNATYSSGNGMLLNKEGKELIFCPQGKTGAVTIPGSVTSIGDCAFFYCVFLTSITIPISVTSIGEDAFDKCSSLTNVYYSGSKADWEKISIDEGNEYLTNATIIYNTSIQCDAPVLSSAANAASGITVKWGAVNGAAKYRVYRKVSGGSWAKVADTASTSYTDTTAKAGTTYYYTVRCLDSTGASCSSYDTKGKACRRLVNQTITSLTNASGGMVVKWPKSTGAAGYYVYRKTGTGSYAKIATITSGSTVSYTDATVKDNNATTYTYAVRAYYGSSSSSYTGKSYVRLTTPAISTLTNVTGCKMKAVWGKKSSVSGYQIQYSTTSDFSSGNKSVTVSGSSIVTKTISSLTKGKTYYVRIRTYKTVSGTNYYSGWSGKKSVKISK